MDNQNRMKVILGDITKCETDAIVNAANSSLMGGGGVDGAIHKAGGKQILNECIEIVNKQGECPTGEAVITSGGLLKAKFVIHTVGPIWNGGNYNEEELLKKCYINCLRIAAQNNIKTIAFPSISTGAYRFPLKLATEIAVRTVDGKLNSYLEIEQVIFVCFGNNAFEYYNKILS